MKRYFCLAMVLMALLMLSSCDSGNDDTTVGGIAGETVQPETKTVAEPEPEPEPENPNATPSSRYHHYNPDSYEMGSDSVSFVLCPGQRYDGCTLNGVPFVKHGQYDEGRETWMLYGNKHLSGEIVCNSGDSYYSAQVRSYGMQFGSCR